MADSSTTSFHSAWLVMQTEGCPAATLPVCFNVHSSSASCFIQTPSEEDERKHRPQWFTQIIKCLLYNQWKIICLPHQWHYSHLCRKTNRMKNEFQPWQHLQTIEQRLEMKECLQSKGISEDMDVCCIPEHYLNSLCTVRPAGEGWGEEKERHKWHDVSFLSHKAQATLNQRERNFSVMENEWCYSVYSKYHGSLWTHNQHYTKRYVLYEVLFHTVFPHTECQEASRNVAGKGFYLFYVLPGGWGK